MDYKLPSSNYLEQLPTNVLGSLLYYSPFFVKKKEIIIENMRRVFKNQLSEEQYQQLIKAFFSHTLLTIKELIFKKCISRSQIDIRGISHLHQALKNGHGVILLTGHFGNWERTIQIDLPKLHGISNHKICIIRRTQSPKLQMILNYLYKPFQFTRVDQVGSVQLIYKELKNNNVIVFPFDHRATQDKSHSIDVEFFGEKASCFRSLALLVKCTGAIVLPLNHYRENLNRTVLEYSQALPWIKNTNTEQEIYDNTLQYNKILEQFILHHPEQWWCWAYKRWKKKF